MLFLAVFCGILAEWQLEHVIEHSREKEFMESMMVDLTTDSATLTNMGSNFELISHHADSLIPLLKDNISLDKNAKGIYQHLVYLNLFTKWIYSLTAVVGRLTNNHRSLIWARWIIARLGGWKSYVSQTSAGPITLKRGLDNFDQMYYVWCLALKYFEDVGIQ